MKVFKYSILVFISVLFINTLYGEDQYVKKYQEVYNVNPESSFRISNTFGNINIQNTNEDRITISAEIIVKTHSQKKADIIFKKIDVNIYKENDIINAQTSIIDKIKTPESSFEINYIIIMPAYLNITLVNKYGNVTIDELTGKSNIAVKYGSLNANRIIDNKEKPISSIELAYSEPSRIKEYNWGKIAMRYSKLKIETGTAIAISSKYSELTLGDFSSVVLEASYNKININTVNNIIIDSKYTDIYINKINKKLKLDSKYGDIDVDKIESNFENININSSYGDVNIQIDSNATYTFEGNFNYGDIDYPNMKILESNKDTHNLFIKGVVGSSLKGNIMIKSNYGDVNID